MKRFHLTLLALAVAASIFTGLRPAAAANDFFTLFVVGPGTCSSNSISYPIGGSGYFSNSWSLNATQWVNGVQISTWTNSPIAAGPFVPDPNGVNVQPFTATMPYTYQQRWFAIENGVTIGEATFTFSCSNGVLSLTNGGYAGPSIPAGFVLRQIICTVPVYDTAGGKPVINGATILNGQTWFVNPKAIVDGKGKFWSEIFAGGFIDGFVPTSCVGAAPANS